MVTITCGACRKPISVDPAKIPPRPVSFPCPACKAPVPVDGRTLAAPPAALVTEPVVTEPVVPQPAAAPPPEPEPAPEMDEFAPKALIVGQDDPMLRHAAQVLGFRAVHFPTVEGCRDFYLQEHPPVVFLNPGQLTRPPLAEIQPLTSIGPVDRRKGFFILLGDGLKTMDGTVAFLYDVDLVITYRDLPSLHRIYREAQEQHQRLYQSFEAAQRDLRG